MTTRRLWIYPWSSRWVPSLMGKNQRRILPVTRKSFRSEPVESVFYVGGSFFRLRFR